MKSAWIVLAVLASVALVATDPALARAKRKPVVVSRCQPEPASPPWRALFEFRPEPRPNGCAPPVYQNGKFVGQDPDPFIRLQLRRDPGTGYSANAN